MVITLRPNWSPHFKRTYYFRNGSVSFFFFILKNNITYFFLKIEYGEVQFSLSCDNQGMKSACVVLLCYSCFTCSSHVFRCTSCTDGFLMRVRYLFCIQDGDSSNLINRVCAQVMV